MKKQKFESCHMPSLMRDFSNKGEISIAKAHEKLRKISVKSRQRFSDFSKLNETKNITKFYRTAKHSREQSSILRASSQAKKIKQIETNQKKKKKLMKIEFSDEYNTNQLKKLNRISIQLASNKKMAQNTSASGTLHYLEKQDLEWSNEKSIHYQVDINPLKNVCYDSQFPYKREGDIMKFLQNRLYVMGGSIRRKFFFPKADQRFKEIQFHFYQNQKWNQQNTKGDDTPRYFNLIGHTVETINRNLLVFTFGMSGDSVQTLYEYNPFIILYNIEKRQFNQFKCNIKLRSHASTNYQNYLLIHGGINHELKVMKQLHILIFLDSDSHPKLVTILTGEALVNHKMVTTLGMDISARIGLKGNDGIFIFGGQNGDGDMNNDLKILRLSPNCLDNEKRAMHKFQKVFSKGKKPCARMNHTMDLLPTKNKIVIIGGTDKQGNFLNDVWIFQLLFSQWIKYKTNPEIKSIFGGLTKHSSAVNDTKVYIFGGQHSIDCGSKQFLGDRVRQLQEASGAAQEPGEGEH